jgi:hypothetical protein
MERERPLASVLVAAAALSLMSAMAWFQREAGPPLQEEKGLVRLVEWEAASGPLDSAWEIMRASFNAPRTKGDSL